MAQFVELQKAQHEMEISWAKRMSEFEAQLKVPTPSVDTLVKLREDFSIFQDLVWKTLKGLRTQLSECVKNIDAMETRHRNKVLLFTGVEEKTNEDSAKVIIDIIHSKLNLPDVTIPSIAFCHRLGMQTTDRPRPLLVRFTNIKTKTDIWDKKSQLKGSAVSILEFLTKYRQSVFMKARKHFGIRNCWTMNGVINLKPIGKERYKISTMEELESLIAKYPTAVSELKANVVKTGTVESVVGDSTKRITRKQNKK